MNLSMRMRSIVLIISYFIIQLLVTPLLFQYVDVDILTIASSVILLLIAVILFGSHLKKAYQEFKRDFDGWRKFLLKSVGFYFLLYLLRFFILMAVMNFMDVDNLMQNQQTLNDLSTTLPFLQLFFLITIYAPMVEELVFREGFIGWVDKNNKTLVTISTTLSVIIFTLLHSFAIVDFLLYLPLSLVITRFYFTYNYNVIASILFHFVNNAIALIFMLVLL